MNKPQIYRRYAPARDIDAAMRTAGDAWLGPRERIELAAWRNDARRQAWLRGRFVAKQLIAERAAVGSEWSTLEILSRDRSGRVNRPRVWLAGVEQLWPLSISHTDLGVLVAFSMDESVTLGVDLTNAATLGDAFARLWFTPAERAWIGRARSPALAGFVWAAKEAIYKAVNRGEQFQPREIETSAAGSCSYRGTPLDRCTLQSWNIENQIAALAIAPSIK